MKLYEYLFNLYYSKEEYKEYYTLDDFMFNWVESNMANESLYESFINDEFIGFHYRSFGIDHKNRIIEFNISTEDVKEGKNISIAIAVTKDKLMDILNHYGKEE